MLKHDLSMMLKHMLQASCLSTCRQAMHPSNARTYGRTNGELLTLGMLVTLGIPRRGAERFPRMRHENSPLAGAARGPEVSNA